MQIKIFKRKIKDKLFGKTTNTALGVQQLEMADARMGAMFMLANTEISKVSSFSNGHFFENFVIGAEPLSDLKTVSMGLLEKTDAMAKFQQTKAGQNITKAVTIVGEATSVVIQKVKQIISDFFRMLVNKVKAVYGEALYTAEWFAEFGTWLAGEFAGNFSSFIPGWGYVQSAADIYSGVKQAVCKSRDLVTQFYAGRGVELLGGHPSIIANALARHSAAGALGGLKNAAVGITKIGLEAAGDAFAGAGMLVSFITGLFERIVGLVDYMVQRTLVGKVLKRAKKEWVNKDSGSSMLKDHKRFSEWFQSAVITTPIIAALVMGSGFVGHPYKFIQLLAPNLAVVSQAEFDKGVIYIEKLKSLSSDYVQEYVEGYSVDFSSRNGVINARLNELKDGKGILDGMEVSVSSTTSTSTSTTTTP
ncbi:hypothetical protein J4N42_16625 [Vibrio sp. SCSIO 43135]|uniref:Uncharacterized protein n=1 Tax=Vibrio paucivorans TaxID=2829489 RepID=A0A9X3HQ83_9VIBR|nr:MULTISPECIES: hypothetical protein [Vibrio]MCW8333295.1 hypothetical protein [Vibrio paucivorans]USD43789.1 hypothetical protein J4N42_16625 [Vibrio sp. SCSIO 43135]